MSNNPTIPFAINWNLKLTNNVWSTIRLQNLNKYQLGKQYDILIQDNCDKWYQNKVFGVAECVFIKHFTLDQITEPLFLLDMGLNKTDGVKMLFHLYEDKINNGCNMMTAVFSYMLFKWKPEHQDAYQHIFQPGINQILNKTA